MKLNRIFAEYALQEVARSHNTTVEEVRKEIQLAMLAGICDPAPAVQAKWGELSCSGDVLTPEKLITGIVEKVIG